MKPTSTTAAVIIASTSIIKDESYNKCSHTTATAIAPVP